MARFDSEQHARILNAAIAVFAEKGLEGATIRRVGELAGFNSALLYYYFESKQTLFAAAVREVVLGLLRELEREERVFAAGRDRLAFLIRGVFRYYGAHPERMRMMGIVHTLHADVLSEVILAVFKEQVPVPLQVLQEGIALGQLKPLHPIQMWWSVLGVCVFTLFMSQVVARLPADAAPVPLPNLADVQEQIIELLSSGLATGKTKAKG